MSPRNEKAVQRWGPVLSREVGETHRDKFVLELGGNMMTLLDPSVISLATGVSIGLVVGWGTVCRLGWLR